MTSNIVLFLCFFLRLHAHRLCVAGERIHYRSLSPASPCPWFKASRVSFPLCFKVLGLVCLLSSLISEVLSFWVMFILVFGGRRSSKPEMVGTGWWCWLGDDTGGRRAVVSSVSRRRG